MFSKGFIVFGLLALFACQGTTALSHQEIDTFVHSEAERLSLGDLISKVKEVLAGLEQLVGGVISDALGTLGNLTNTLKELKEKYLQGGIDAITGAVDNVVEFIKNATNKATEIGVDISECVAGQDVGLDKLTTKLIGELTTCITGTVNKVLTMVNNDIKTVQQLVGNVTAIPAKLSKCLLTIKPVACVTELLKDVTGLLTTIPTQILNIVNEATGLVNQLPTQLLGCVNGIVATAATETTNTIANIAVCVEDKMTAADAPPARLANRLSLTELIKQIKEIIGSLEKLVSGVIGDALKTLGNLISTITTIKDKFLGEGIAAITGGIGNVVEFIKNKTQEAAELGIDIAKCITGRDKQLEQLASGLTKNLTDCITTTVGSVMTMVNNDIKIINQIVGNVTKIPVKLTQCMITIRPIKCLEDLLKDAASMLKNLPGQILAIVNEATTLVKELPTQLLGCVENIASSTVEQTTGMITEIESCVDELIGGNSTDPIVPPGEVNRASIGEIADKIKEIIASLNALVSGVIGDALKTLRNLISTITTIKDKFLGEGIAAITGGIGNVIDFIKNKTQEAAELGINIAECITGRDKQLEQLASGLTANLTTCVTSTVGKVLTMVNNDIKIINQIVSNVTKIPVKLTQCMITIRPIKCLENLLKDAVSLLANLPGQIIAIVNEATTLVKELPTQLLGCVENISSSTVEQTTGIITDIGLCVDKIIDDNDNSTLLASF